MDLNTTEAPVNVCFHDSPQTKLGRLDPPYMTYYYGTFFLLTVVNIVGNSIVLTTFYRHRDMRTPSNSFVCSLAVSDLMVGLMYPFYNVAHIETPPIKASLGQWWVCMLLITEVTSLQSCSSYSLVAITVSRLLIIVHPLRYRVYLTKGKCVAAAAIVWVACHVICVSVYLAQPKPKVYCNICRYELIFPARIMTFLTVFQFAIPLLIMVTANAWMAYTAQSLSKRIALGFTTHVGKHTRGLSALWHGQKSFAVVTLLVGCFTLSWTPMVIYCFVIIVGNVDVAGQEYFSATARISLYLNYSVNVFIYAGRMADFREHVRHDLRQLFCQTSRVAPSSVTGRATPPRKVTFLSDYSSRRPGRGHRGSRPDNVTCVTFQRKDSVHESDDTTKSDASFHRDGTRNKDGTLKQENGVVMDGTLVHGDNTVIRDRELFSYGTVRDGAVHLGSHEVHNDGRVHRTGEVHSHDTVYQGNTVHSGGAVQTDGHDQRGSLQRRQSVAHKSQKINRDGTVYIMRDGVIYRNSSTHCECSADQDKTEEGAVWKISLTTGGSNAFDNRTFCIDHSDRDNVDHRHNIVQREFWPTLTLQPRDLEKTHGAVLGSAEWSGHFTSRTSQ